MLGMSEETIAERLMSHCHHFLGNKNVNTVEALFHMSNELRTEREKIIQLYRQKLLYLANHGGMIGFEGYDELEATKKKYNEQIKHLLTAQHQHFLVQRKVALARLKKSVNRFLKPRSTNFHRFYCFYNYISEWNNKIIENETNQGKMDTGKNCQIRFLKCFLLTSLPLSLSLSLSLSVSLSLSLSLSLFFM
jgi:hypothetical protein